MGRRTLSALSALALLTLARPADAEIVAKSDNGFAIHLAIEVKASPEDAWEELLKPADWWDKQHTFSGDANNLTIDAMPGGCFCEVLPPEKDGGAPGGVQHMRVIHVAPGKVLRMSGALGPLQGEAVTGTFTATLRPTDRGTRIVFEYLVGGFMRYTVDQIAPPVDAMFSEQLIHLADRLGRVDENAASGKKRQAKKTAAKKAPAQKTPALNTPVQSSQPQQRTNLPAGR